MTAIDVTALVRTQLLTVTAVTDLVNTRIYPDVLPQNPTLPAVAIEEISSTSEHDLVGKIGMARSRVRIKAYHEYAAEANQLRALCEAAWVANGSTFRGNITIPSSGGTWFVHDCMIETRGDGVDPPIDGSDEWRRYKFTDLIVLHKE